MDKAVRAYETAAGLDPQSDTSLVKLGNLFYTEERYKEAKTAYQKAVAINPNAKQERYDKAVGLFERAIEKDPEFFSSYLELGITLADAGRIDDAIKQFNLLLEKDDALADQPSRYIYKVDKPKLMFANAASSVTYTLPMRTQLSVLNTYLETAGAAKDFTMMFQFDKQMSRDSVENVYNWGIGRADGSVPGNRYNFGLSVDDTEVALPSFPTHVAYDADNYTATLRFSLRQNAAGDATVDPAHVVFTSRGEDAFGNPMDSASDQFSGFSGVA